MTGARFASVTLNLGLAALLTGLNLSMYLAAPLLFEGWRLLTAAALLPALFSNTLWRLTHESFHSELAASRAGLARAFGSPEKKESPGVPGLSQGCRRSRVAPAAGGPRREAGRRA